MTELPGKNRARGNAYYIQRLRKIGREDLIKAIEAKETNVDTACKEVGIRKRRSQSGLDILFRHWDKSPAADRAHFFSERRKQILEAFRLAIDLKLTAPLRT